MATIPVGQGSFMRPYRRVRTRAFPEAASQSFIRGDVLVLQTTADKGNQVKKAGADPTTGIVGVAAEDASGTENNKVLVYLADDEAEFVAHCQDAGVLDADDIGDTFSVVEDAANKIWRVDRSDTGNAVVRVLELLDAVGDTDGRYVFKFTSTARGVYGA